MIAFNARILQYHFQLRLRINPPVQCSFPVCIYLDISIDTVKHMAGKHILISTEGADRKTVLRPEQHPPGSFQQFSQPCEQFHRICCSLHDSCCHNIIVFLSLLFQFPNCSLKYIYSAILQSLTQHFASRIAARDKKYLSIRLKSIPVDQSLWQIPDHFLCCHYHTSSLSFIFRNSKSSSSTANKMILSSSIPQADNCRFISSAY